MTVTTQVNATPDLQLPEMLINCIDDAGNITQAPILFQRDGETLEQFEARIKRVEAALATPAPQPQEIGTDE